MADGPAPALTSQWRSGVLKKAGGVGGRQRQDRWFELRGTALWYYSERPRGCIDLSSSELEIVDDGKTQWTLKGPNLDHDYTLAAADDDEKQGWVDAIRRCRLEPGGEDIQRRVALLETERDALVATQQKLGEDVRGAEYKVDDLIRERDEAAAEAEATRERAAEAEKEHAEALQSTEQRAGEAEEKLCASVRRADQLAEESDRAREAADALRSEVQDLTDAKAALQSELQALRVKLEDEMERSAVAATDRAEERGRLRSEIAAAQRSREEYEKGRQQLAEDTATAARDAERAMEELRAELGAATRTAESSKAAHAEAVRSNRSTEQELERAQAALAALRKESAAQLSAAEQRAEEAMEELLTRREAQSVERQRSAASPRQTVGDLSEAISDLQQLVPAYDDWAQGTLRTSGCGTDEGRAAVAAAAAAPSADEAVAMLGAGLKAGDRAGLRSFLAQLTEQAAYAPDMLVRAVVLPSSLEAAARRAPDQPAPQVLLVAATPEGANELASCIANAASDVRYSERRRISTNLALGADVVVGKPGRRPYIRIIVLPPVADIAATLDDHSSAPAAALEAAIDAAGGAPAAVCLVAEQEPQDVVDAATSACARLLPGGASSVWLAARSAAPSGVAVPEEQTLSLGDGALWKLCDGTDEGRKRWCDLGSGVTRLLDYVTATEATEGDAAIWRIVHPQGALLTPEEGEPVPLPCGGGVDALCVRDGVLRVLAPLRGTVPHRDTDGSPNVVRASLWAKRQAEPEEWSRGDAAEIAVVRRSLLCGWAPCIIVNGEHPPEIVVIDSAVSRCLRVAHKRLRVSDASLLRRRVPVWNIADLPQTGHSSSGAAMKHPPGEGCDQGRLNSPFAWVAAECKQAWYQLLLVDLEPVHGVVLRGSAGGIFPGVTSVRIEATLTTEGEDGWEVMETPTRQQTWSAPCEGDDDISLFFAVPRLCKRVRVTPLQWNGLAPAMRCGLILDRPSSIAATECIPVTADDEWTRYDATAALKAQIEARELRSRERAAESEAVAARLSAEKKELTAAREEMDRINEELRACILSLRSSGEMVETVYFTLKQGAYPHPLVGMEVSPDLQILSASPALPAGKAGVPEGARLLRVGQTDVKTKEEAVKAVRKEGQKEFSVLVAISSVAPSVAALRGEREQQKVEITELQLRVEHLESRDKGHQKELIETREKLRAAKAAAAAELVQSFAAPIGEPAAAPEAARGGECEETLL